jgi:hypothetical protein
VKRDDCVEGWEYCREDGEIEGLRGCGRGRRVMRDDFRGMGVQQRGWRGGEVGRKAGERDAVSGKRRRGRLWARNDGGKRRCRRRRGR